MPTDNYQPDLPLPACTWELLNTLLEHIFSATSSRRCFDRPLAFANRGKRRRRAYSQFIPLRLLHMPLYRYPAVGLPALAGAGLPLKSRCERHGHHVTVHFGRRVRRHRRINGRAHFSPHRLLCRGSDCSAITVHRRLGHSGGHPSCIAGYPLRERIGLPHAGRR